MAQKQSFKLSEISGLILVIRLQYHSMWSKLTE